MAQKSIDPKVLESAKKYRLAVEAMGVPVSKIVLFGSYAKGTEHRGSDIDLAVVSSAFGHDLVDEMQMLWKKTRSADVRIEPYPLSVEEYEEGFSPIVAEIRKCGVEV